MKNLCSKCGSTKSLCGTRLRCRQCIREYSKTQREKRKQYKRRKRKDPEYLRKEAIRAMKAKRWEKQGSVTPYIGCSPEELRKHIESQFLPGMTWDNHGEWHVDHIIPLSSGKTEEDMLKLNHYSNLQPLWAIDNIRKSNHE